MFSRSVRFNCLLKSARPFRSYATQARVTFSWRPRASPKYASVIAVLGGASFYQLYSNHRSQVRSEAPAEALVSENGQSGVLNERETLQISQDELAEEQSQNRVIRFVTSYVFEPLLVIFRFCELSLIFAPVLLSYPILTILGPRNRRTGTNWGKLVWNRYLKKSLEWAGPCFIKLGQWAASRTDIFSANLCEELGKLHSDAKPHTFHATKRIILKSLGTVKGIKWRFDEIFEEFNEKPLGVGSIAQVYVAKLSEKYLNMLSEEEHEAKADTKKKFSLQDKFTYFKKSAPKPNQYVAIKVMHPKVERKIHRDLRIMKFFANFINAIPTMEWLSLPEEADNFNFFMNTQLDLRIEGSNLQQFIENFKDKKTWMKHNKMVIRFPKPYLKCSSRRVLVEEYIHGIPISLLLELSAIAQKRVASGKASSNEREAKFLNYSKILSNEILDSFLQMLIIDNFIHSDLHPGNIFVGFYKMRENNVQKLTKQEERDISEDIKTLTNELLSLEKKLKQNKVANLHSDHDYNAILDKFCELNDSGYRPEVCYIDTGLVTQLNEKDRVNFLDLFGALTTFDGYRAGELMIERSRDPSTAIDPEIFALKVQRLVGTIKNRAFTLGNVSIGDLLEKMLTMVRLHHVRMEPDFVNVVVAILLLEGIGRQLNPQLDLFASAVPVLREANMKNASLLSGTNSFVLVLFWMALEARSLIHATIQEIDRLVVLDSLAPNI